MKRMKFLLPIIPLILGGCSIFAKQGDHPPYNLGAKPIAKDSNKEIKNNIHYGESFNIKDFEVYRDVGLERYQTIDKGDYGVQFLRGDEQSFFSDKPEVGWYEIEFSYKEKNTVYQTITKVLQYCCELCTSYPEGTHIELDDIDYGEISKKPRLVGLDTTEYTSEIKAQRLTEDDYYGDRFDYPYKDGEELRMTLMPGDYTVWCWPETNHYYGTYLETSFTVNKIAFDSTKYELSCRSPNLSYIDGRNTIGGYNKPYNPKILNKATGEQVPEFIMDHATFEWKNPDEPIVTGTPKTYTVICINPYFIDFEVDVSITIATKKVYRPNAFQIDETSYANNTVTYDRNEHEVTWFFRGDGYYMDEHSTTKATNPGEYQVIFKLSNPGYAVWSDTNTTEDVVFTWRIVKASWTLYFSYYEFRIGERVLDLGQDGFTTNTFTYDEIINREIKIWVRWQYETDLSKPLVDYGLQKISKEDGYGSGYVTLTDNRITAVQNPGWDVKVILKLELPDELFITVLDYAEITITFPAP